MSAAVFGINAAHAQAFLENPLYGKTPEERQKVIELINYLKDHYDAQEYDDAVRTLDEIRAIKPDANAGVYTYVSNIYKRKINAAQSVSERNAYVDSLMRVYDWRIELSEVNPQLFGNKNQLQMQKAGDYMELKSTDKDGIRELYSKAIEDYGTEAPLNDVIVYFDFLANEYMALRLETDDFMTEYEKLENIIDASGDPEKSSYKQTLENKFIQSGAADCNNVEKIYRPKIAETPDDIELYKKAFYLLNIGTCDSDFMFELAEKLYQAEPSTQMALYLSQFYEEKGNMAKSNQYIQEAIATETDPMEKSRLLTRQAAIELGGKNTTRAITNARQAINLDPGNGMAQLLLANAYSMSSRSGCSEFDQQAYFWVIYDMASRARTLLQERGETGLISSADAVMANARSNWPDGDEMFLRNISEGSSYTVNCGVVNQSTRARAK